MFTGAPWRELSNHMFVPKSSSFSWGGGGMDLFLTTGMAWWIRHTYTHKHTHSIKAKHTCNNTLRGHTHGEVKASSHFSVYHHKVGKWCGVLIITSYWAALTNVH